MKRLGRWLSVTPHSRLRPFAVPSRGFGLLLILFLVGIVLDALLSVSSVAEAVPSYAEVAIRFLLLAGAASVIVSLILVRNE